ncbi:hypothetical protein [Pyrodictium occultum]|nr:hypothetical protein [Pyrodictium occultum]
MLHRVPGALETVSRLLGGQGLEEAWEAVEALDSCYRILDEECTVHAVIVLAAAEEPRDLLSGERRARAAREAGRALREALERVRLVLERPGVKAYYLESGAYVASYVGRRLTAASPGDVMIPPPLGAGERQGLRLRPRSASHRLDRLLELLRGRGCRPAGRRRC